MPSLDKIIKHLTINQMILRSLEEIGIVEFNLISFSQKMKLEMSRKWHKWTRKTLKKAHELETFHLINKISMWMNFQ